jgi:hypothetical protein
MWQSHNWNGQEAAFRMFVVVGLVLLLLLQPDTESNLKAHSATITTQSPHRTSNSDNDVCEIDMGCAREPSDVDRRS